MIKSPFYLAGLVSLSLCFHCCGTNKAAEQQPAPPAPEPAAATFKTLHFLQQVSGKNTLAGIHNREPNAEPSRWTDSIFASTGTYPALWSGDFLFQEENISNRRKMIDEAVRQWQKGAVVNIMWHACNPALEEPCGWDKSGVLSKLTDEQWNELITDGSALNKKWKARVDEVALYLQILKDKGVEVLWRPMHEMNQGVFWWGGRPGASGTRRLYQLLHDYMVKEKKLTNLIWVWDIQDFPTLASDAVTYDPGSAYWDVLALDIYDDASGFSKEKYEIMLKAAGAKPMAIGECQKLPTPEQLAAQPKWTFFMSWSELTYSHNSREQIRALYAAAPVLTLDELPGW
ncbi:MAG: glycosyl hydrolase [Candidatus Pseudobacter hemicellulosilyticus]|uniref:Glycosyl hydrolase n=1 Tax=Candidatus Pseudobacter hemicellulosilyticus TaxID=3121375 RepID=A0AAJ6BIM9_9BACT|nr:MAG: glycosyl hydrolase [Pseudobacter sp.]